MHVRASAQDIDDPTTVYALTQEPSGHQSQLFVLRLLQPSVATNSTNATIGFRIVSTIVLPKRGGSPGEGGADVISLGE
jgi:hypothetical protein